MLSSATARLLNVVALLLLALPLLGAFGIQIIMHELPCPLCLLQRVGMLGVAAGILMNVKFGIRPMHYGIAITAALIGAAVSTRQILLHIAPTIDGITGFGDPVMGLHLYTWALVVFMASILGSALLMIFTESDTSTEQIPHSLNALEKAIFGLFILLALANTAGAFLECGLSPCPDDPVEYKMLS